MENQNLPHFIFLDDDPLENMICKKVTHLMLPGASVETFTNPAGAIMYIQTKYSNKHSGTAVLFLDVHMPLMNGWDVLGQIRNFPDNIKQRLSIFVLSSSKDIADREQAENDPLVVAYMLKPLTIYELQGILQNYKNELAAASSAR
jgi:CheY-like chemotaxis protein